MVKKILAPKPFGWRIRIRKNGGIQAINIDVLCACEGWDRPTRHFCKTCSNNWVLPIPWRDIEIGVIKV